MYRIWARFEKFDIYDNGRWRVRHSEDMPPAITKMVHNGGWALAIASTKPYPIGSIINPTKELNRVLKARR